MPAAHCRAPSPPLAGHLAMGSPAGGRRPVTVDSRRPRGEGRPWAHGEARLGGFPDWLAAEDCAPRTDDPRYLALVRRNHTAVAHELRGLSWFDGGPLVAVQVENELYDQPDHLATLRRLAADAGRLIADPFWYGPDWEIGLRRHAAAAAEHGDELRILPLAADSEIHVDPEHRAGLAAAHDTAGIDTTALHAVTP